MKNKSRVEPMDWEHHIKTSKLSSDVTNWVMILYYEWHKLHRCLLTLKHFLHDLTQDGTIISVVDHKSMKIPCPNAFLYGYCPLLILNGYHGPQGSHRLLAKTMPVVFNSIDQRYHPPSTKDIQFMTAAWF